MKILLISLNFFPEITGVGKYSGELSFWLKKKCDVRVITTHPYYPVSANLEKKFIFKWSIEIVDGVKIYRCPLLIPFRDSTLIRVCHLMAFTIFSLPIALWQIFWRPNIVIAVQPTFFSLPVALLVSRLVSAKSIMHIQDFELDAAFKLNMLSGKFLRRIVSSVEKFIMMRFSLVVTISQKMVQQSISKGVESAKVFFLPNWINLDYFNNINEVKKKKISTQLRNMGIPERAVIALYSGSMGRKQGLSILADLARLSYSNAELKCYPVHFIFCGDGPSRGSLIKECEGIPNVHFLDFLPYDELVSLFDLIDIHLLPQKAGIADLVLPSKLTGMLASGKPIIATAKKGTELSCMVSNCGVVVEPENISELLGALVKLANNIELRNSLGDNAKSYAVRNLEKELVLSKFYQKLRELHGR